MIYIGIKNYWKKRLWQVKKGPYYSNLSIEKKYTSICPSGIILDIPMAMKLTGKDWFR